MLKNFESQGIRTRTRGSEQEVEECQELEFCPWSSWTTCTKSCDGGFTTRNRNPSGIETKASFQV